MAPGPACTNSPWHTPARAARPAPCLTGPLPSPTPHWPGTPGRPLPLPPASHSPSSGGSSRLPVPSGSLPATAVSSWLTPLWCAAATEPLLHHGLVLGPSMPTIHVHITGAAQHLKPGLLRHADLLARAENERQHHAFAHEQTLQATVRSLGIPGMFAQPPVLLGEALDLGQHHRLGAVVTYHIGVIDHPELWPLRQQGFELGFGKRHSSPSSF